MQDIAHNRGASDAAHAWLCTFARQVRECDYDAARLMFCKDVTAFGSWTQRMDGIDDLIERQWRNVWPRTREFEFDLAGAFGDVSDFGGWIAASWSSYAREADGTAGLLRTGRATFVFRRERGALLAVHSHFSLMPTGRL